MPAPEANEAMWFEDPRGFIRDDRLAKFIPWPDSTLSEKLNALMRFSLYYAAFLFLFQRSYAVLYIPLIVALVTYLVYTADVKAGEDRFEQQTSMAGVPVTVDRRTGEACAKPTKDNPYMNVLMSDSAERPPACDLGKSSVAKEAETNFSGDLYRDVDDVFGRRSSSRQFYTTPNTATPNDRGGFAQWLYGDAPSCKDGNGEACVARVHRFLPGL